MQLAPSAGERLWVSAIVPSARPADAEVRAVAAQATRILEALKAHRRDEVLAGLAPEFVSSRFGDRATIAKALSAREDRTDSPASWTLWGADRQGDLVVVRHVVTGWTHGRSATAPGQMIETAFRKDAPTGRWLATSQTSRAPTAGFREVPRK